jgi:hypothetical protein
VQLPSLEGSLAVTVASVGVGVILLLFGRKLFWLLVGSVGFVAGLSAATLVYAAPSDPGVLLVALGCGVVGAILALLVQKIAIRVAGFVGGALLVLSFLHATTMESEGLLWAIVLIGGITGTILIGIIFDWVLIVLSSFCGAYLVVHGFALQGDDASFVLLALFAVGIVVQGRTKMTGRTGNEKEAAAPR